MRPYPTSVYRHGKQTYRVRVSINGKSYHFGTFAAVVEAANFAARLRTGLGRQADIKTSSSNPKTDD